MQSFFILGLIFGIPYFIPTIVALIRKKKNKAAIFVMNFFLGWTFIGWVVALMWAVIKDTKVEVVVENKSSSIVS